MGTSRRDFLIATAGLAGAAALAGIARAQGGAAGKGGASPPAEEGDDVNIGPAKKPLRILVLGGTGFTGPHFVRLALRRGHHVTVFNRGQTERRIGMLPDAVERLTGDRDLKKENLESLKGDAKWDACLDTIGMYPRQVRNSAAILKGRVGHYVYVSSVSVYENPKKGADVDAPLAQLKDPAVEEMGAQFENYGGLKALCEGAAEEAFPGKCAVVRPSFISGPGDPTDRFTYWPVRVSRGGEVLVPGSPGDPIQYIDSRDLAAFYLTLCENATPGVFNAAAPNPPAGIGDLVRTCKEVSGSDASFTWVKDAAFLEEHGLGFPIWVPPEGEQSGLPTVSIERSLRAGMKVRPMAATVRDTLAWWPHELERRARVTKEIKEEAASKGKPEPKMADPSKLRAGPSREEEAAALKALKEKAGAEGKKEEPAGAKGG
jgi:2'-hydroxyisoflavone reductase